MDSLKGFITVVFKTLLVCLFIIGILFLVFAKGSIDKLWGMYYVHLGDEAFKKNEMQYAINYYKQGLELFPAHYEAWLNLGNIYVSYEDYFSATEAYENAIMQKKNYTPALMNLGIITAEKLGDFDDAIEQYQTIITNKNFPVVIPFIFNNIKSEKINKGLAYYNMGHAYSQKAIYISDKNKEEKLETIGRAITSYEHAAEIIPNNYDVRYNLALGYHILGDYRKAGINYCKAIEVEPMNYEAHYNLGIMLKHMNQELYAIDELEKSAVLSTGKISGNTKYIFDILNDMSKTASIHEDIDLKKKQTATPEPPIIFINGKVTPTEEANLAIIENFRTCSSKVLFEQKD